MFYIDNDSGVTVMPPVSAQRSAIVRWFSEGDGNNVITWPGMDWFNIVQAELLNTLEEAGIQPDKTKLNQLALSIKAIMSNNALLIKNNLSEIKTAGASAQRTARENLDIYDASLNKKGLVQLTSATDSPSETLAATAKAVKIAMDNANARLAKDRNGADIPNKPLFIQNLGLQETVNKAGNAVQRSGDTMTGKLNLPQTSAFGVNTDNALGGNSITLGDNDTGFRQDGDGIISFYSNGSRIGHIDELGLHLYKDIESNGSNFRLKSNYRHHITFANEDGSIRMFLWKDNGGDGVHINNGSDGGGDFIFKTDGGFALGSGAQVASSGDIYGSVWENNWLSTWLHNHVVRDIRLGSIEYKNVWRDYGFGDASGYVLTAAINSNADDIVDTVARRPIQKLIGGIWYNVGSV
ncbi:tail fiber protein [Escherichia coli]|uniref:tail fiber protein n=3 Tax=Escherichia coli TaxID=562 RepID=UPI0012D65B92|nr:tail fiber protein [Escherichia coli]EBV2440854.1 phage tail protein [Salmonella enterica subsp. enterica serovar Kedougou]MCY6898295.1 tail fiber protein [Escherichia coli]